MWHKKSMIPAVMAASLTGAGAMLPVASAHAYAEGEGTAAAGSKDSRGQRESAIPAESAKDSKKSEKQLQRMQVALDDAWLDGKLDTALLFTDELNAFAIDTQVEDGVAHLSGTVSSEIERDLAQEIAQSVEGVDSVRNNLTIDETSDATAAKSAESGADEQFRDAVENAVLTARIKSELLLNSATAGLSIDVDSSREAVTLDGTVSSQAASALAEQIAQNVSGEREVKNKLQVKRSS